MRNENVPAETALFDARGFLQDLRRRAATGVRRTAGRFTFGCYDIAYADVQSFYMEFKDIFVQRIYHFATENKTPTIVDGGGCIGMATVYFKSVYPNARIVCFEPDPEVFEILQRNVEVNRLDDVRLVRGALAECAGTASFAPDGADGGRLVDRSPADAAVETVRLSGYLDEPVDCLKLNIEGKEWVVLEEAAASGRLANVKRIVIEYHGWPEVPQRLGAILNLLHRHGFRYQITNFDHETCPATGRPYMLDCDTTWFCLIHAVRVPIDVAESRL